MRSALVVATGVFLVALAAPALGAVGPDFSSADQDFRARRSEVHAFDALRKYRAIWLDSGRASVEAGWKLAMSCYFTGLRLTSDTEGKERLFREGAEAAEESLKLAPTCAACEFWAAIDTALLGETVGVFKMLSALGQVKVHLKRVLELDPGYAYGGAYRLLGLIDQRLPGILGGDNQRARDYFDKAIRTAPDEPLNYLFMARLLAHELGDLEQAEIYAKRGLEAKPSDPSRIESFEAIDDLKAFLSGLREARRLGPAESTPSRRQGRA